MLACKLAATGFRGVELNEDSLSLNELAETPLDNFALLSGIFALYRLCGSHDLSKVVDLVSVRFTVDGEEKTSCTGRGSKGDRERLVISESRATCMSELTSRSASNPTIVGSIIHADPESGPYVLQPLFNRNG